MAKRLAQPEDLFRLRTLGDPSVSPDGERAAWVQAEPDETSDRVQTSIWVAPLDGSASPAAFTFGPSDTSPRWSPDGHYLAYVTSPPEGPSQLGLAPLTGGVPRPLGSFPGPVSQAAWSPDSTQLVVVSLIPSSRTEPAQSGQAAPEPAQRSGDRSAQDRNAPRIVRGLAARYDNVGWFEGRRHVFVVDVSTGTSRQVTSGDYDNADPSWSPDGKWIAFSSDRGRGRDDRQLRSDVYVVVAGGGRARRVTRGEGRTGVPVFSPDGAKIAFVGHEGGDAWNHDLHLYVVPADESAGPRVVAPATDRPVPWLPGTAPPFQWLTNEDIAVLVADRGCVGLQVARLGEARSKVIVGGDRQVDGFSVGRDGRAVAFTSAWPDSPSECYSIRLGAKGASSRARSAVRQVSHANDEFLADVLLGRVTRATTTAEDGTPVEYFAIEPPGKASGPRPVHLDIHGGPHGAWPAGRFLAFHQAIAAAGYLVVLPNPRGSSGYGQAFTAACTGDWGGADAADILACVDDVVARGLGDGRRQFVSGGSYGGFMTSWLAGHTHRFRAATAMAAVIDQNSMFGTTDIPGFVEFNFGLPWDNAREYELRSPLTYAKSITTPMLILHWEGDLRVPISQGEELYAVLRRLGHPVEFVRYPGGSHVSRSPSQNVDWARRLLAWNERHGQTGGNAARSGVRGRRRV
jgi:dipeptidyl aminopeptidase/acylaminoacyl peptidase